MEETAGVQAHIRKLCGCLLDAAFFSVPHRDALLTSLQPPSKNNACCKLRQQQIRRLVHHAYDILLLRKWTWFGSWEDTPLSPLCWCVAYGYGYHMRGRGSEGQRLNSLLERFSSEPGTLLPPTHHVIVDPFLRQQWSGGEGGSSSVPGSVGWGA